MGHKGFAALTVLFLVLTWFSWKNEKQVNVAATANTTVSRTQATNIASARPITSEHANIDATLHIVKEKFKQKIDVNGDGKTNCIDAAVTFYKYYPDKSKVCIMINYNPKTGMNHLFNCVFTDGVWRAVEPQAYYTNYKSYWMRDVWGNEYDRSFNRDETDKWKVYAR
jgi:hypothetical protein